MRFRWLAVVVAASPLLPATAQTNAFISFTNRFGPHLNVQVVRVTDTAVIWSDTNSGAAGSVNLADLPPDLQNRFGFDATKYEQLEQERKAAREAARQRQAALEADPARRPHWEQLSLLDSKLSAWSRYECSVRNERGQRLAVIIANLPPQLTYLPRQIQSQQDKLSALDSAIQAGSSVIAQAELQKRAAMAAYGNLPDNLAGTTAASPGATAEPSGSGQAAIQVMQAQIDRAQLNLDRLKAAYAQHLQAQQELRQKLSTIKVRAFFTGQYFNGLQVWDCTPR